MYNNLTFLSNPVNKALMLIHLTLWTFSVGSYMGRMQPLRLSLLHYGKLRPSKVWLDFFRLRWTLVDNMKSNTMLKYLGGCCTGGDLKPTKSEGGGSERQRAG